MFCSKCGNEIDSSKKFCPKCGSLTAIGRSTLRETNTVNNRPRTSKVGKIFSSIGFGVSILALFFTIHFYLLTRAYQDANDGGSKLGYAFLMFFFIIFACASDAISIAFSIVGIKKANNKVLAIIGLVLGIVSLVLFYVFVSVLPLLN